MSEEKKTFLKVRSLENDYYLMVKYESDEEVSFNITLVNGKDVWCGNVSNEDLKDQAASAEKPIDQFLAECKAAFALDDSHNANKFCYDVEIEEDSAKVSWKQVLDHGIKFQLGSAKLQKDKNVNIQLFLDAAIGQFSKMKAEMAALSKANENLLKEREKTMKRLEEFTTAKNDIEKDLYQKFAAVLNEKKAKIRELKQRCEDFKYSKEEIKDFFKDINEVGSSSPQRAVPPDMEKTAGPPNTKNHEYDDEDTDDENERITANSKQSKIQRKIPVILDGDDTEEEVAPVAKRKANNKRQRDNTASIIPRTTSLPRPMKREGSSSSNESAQDFLGHAPLSDIDSTALPAEALSRKSSQRSAGQSTDNIDKLMDEL